MKLVDILLVEDNPDHAILTRRVLEENMVINKVYIVEDGEEALDFMYRRGKYVDRKDLPNPGLILLDVKLPKLNGFEVLKTLKSDPEFRKIPVVMLTTSSRDEEVARGYAEGANSYVSKPVRFDEFTEKVKGIGIYWGMVNSMSAISN
ncbi:response regulator [Candidatus Poribacteria bacterium]|nr:response regulator [Candidatus Poribacteria bacterium]